MCNADNPSHSPFRVSTTRKAQRRNILLLVGDLVDLPQGRGWAGFRKVSGCSRKGRGQTQWASTPTRSLAAAWVASNRARATASMVEVKRLRTGREARVGENTNGGAFTSSSTVHATLLAGSTMGFRSGFRLGVSSSENEKFHPLISGPP